jgi:hypothetical protein
VGQQSQQRDAGIVSGATAKKRLKLWGYLKGTSRHYPTKFEEDWHLAQLINALFGWPLVTPWSVRWIPQDDIDEILYKLDARQQLGEVYRDKTADDQ